MKKGELSASDKPAIAVATPPEFKGHAGVWSPEDLFVSSVNTCLLSTFLFFAEREGLTFKDYTCEAQGVLEKTAAGLMFTKIELRPRVVVSSEEDALRVRRLLEQAESNCLISRSIKSAVSVQPTVEVYGKC